VHDCFLHSAAPKPLAGFSILTTLAGYSIAGYSIAGCSIAGCSIAGCSILTTLAGCSILTTPVKTIHLPRYDVQHFVAHAMHIMPFVPPVVTLPFLSSGSTTKAGKDQRTGRASHTHTAL